MLPNSIARDQRQSGPRQSSSSSPLPPPSLQSQHYPTSLGPPSSSHYCSILKFLRRLGTRSRLFWQQHSMNIRQHSTGSNRDIAEQPVQFFIILDCQSNVPWNDTGLFVITGGVASKLQNFGAEVFQDGCQVHGGSGTHTGSVLALTEVTTNTTDRELQSSLGG